MISAEMEPLCATILARREADNPSEPYRAMHREEIEAILQRFFATKRPGATVGDVRRVGGGASKEQFFFSLHENGRTEALLLRMDPRLAITETDRMREFVLLRAMQGVVPVPEPLWVDNDAEFFPQPALIMRVVDGVAKPSKSQAKVTGLGTWLGPGYREKLSDQFLDMLVAIHAYDWRDKPLPDFGIPGADPKQAARWSVNYWRELWRVDGGGTRPVVALAEQWLVDHLPDTADLVLTHGDYRTGNYLFDEETCEVTALLDWELARIGDFHEDLAWVLIRIFGTYDNGLFRASDLFEREEFIRKYEERSGRTVDRETLFFYELFSSYKCYVIVAANGLAAARSQQNHQDVLLTFLASAAPMFAAELVDLLSQGGPR